MKNPPAPPLALYCHAHIADAAGQHRCEVQLRGSPPAGEFLLKPGTNFFWGMPRKTWETIENSAWTYWKLDKMGGFHWFYHLELGLHRSKLGFHQANLTVVVMGKKMDSSKKKWFNRLTFKIISQASKLDLHKQQTPAPTGQSIPLLAAHWTPPKKEWLKSRRFARMSWLVDHRKSAGCFRSIRKWLEKGSKFLTTGAVTPRTWTRPSWLGS